MFVILDIFLEMEIIFAMKFGIVIEDISGIINKYYLFF